LSGGWAGELAKATSLRDRQKPTEDAIRTSIFASRARADLPRRSVTMRLTSLIGAMPKRAFALPALRVVAVVDPLRRAPGRRKYELAVDDDHEFFSWRRRHQVVLGHDVWIGHGAILLPGVKIGTGAAIGAGSVVTKNVPDFRGGGGRAGPSDSFPLCREFAWL